MEVLNLSAVEQPEASHRHTCEHGQVCLQGLLDH